MASPLRRKSFRKLSNTRVKEIKERSATAKSKSIPTWSAVKNRAFTPSMAVTLGSDRIFHARLVVTNIYRHHMRRSALQKAVREPAGGRADIETAPPGWINLEKIQSRFQLEPSPGSHSVRAPRLESVLRRHRVSQVCLRPVHSRGPDPPGSIVARVPATQSDLDQPTACPGELYFPAAIF